RDRGGAGRRAPPGEHADGEPDDHEAADDAEPVRHGMGAGRLERLQRAPARRDVRGERGCRGGDADERRGAPGQETDRAHEQSERRASEVVLNSPSCAHTRGSASALMSRIGIAAALVWLATGLAGTAAYVREYDAHRGFGAPHTPAGIPQGT